MDRIKLKKGDITKMEVDAVVNAANSSLKGGGGVDGAIHSAGGSAILEECKEWTQEHGKLPTGEAMITSAGEMPSKKVIHTVGPVWNGGNKNEEKKLANAYTNSLKIATENDLETIAFPNISTGVYGFPKKKAAKIAIETVKQFLGENNEFKEVIFVCFDNENHQIYRQLLKD